MNVHKAIRVLKKKNGEVLEVRVDSEIQAVCANQNVRSCMAYAIKLKEKL